MEASSGLCLSALTTSVASASGVAEDGKQTRGRPSFIAASQAQGVTYHTHNMPRSSLNPFCNESSQAASKSAADGAAHKSLAGKTSRASHNNAFLFNLLAM